MWILIRDSVERKTSFKFATGETEYLAIYTTEYDDCYVLETIAAEDMQILRSEMDGQPERVMEAVFNYDVKDETAGFTFSDRHVKIRKLNHKIGENLKLLYGYRCQI